MFVRGRGRRRGRERGNEGERDKEEQRIELGRQVNTLDLIFKNHPKEIYHLSWMKEKYVFIKSEKRLESSQES